jgi:hypothetical protein
MTLRGHARDGGRGRPVRGGAALGDVEVYLSDSLVEHPDPVVQHSGVTLDRRRKNYPNVVLLAQCLHCRNAHGFYILAAAHCESGFDGGQPLQDDAMLPHLQILLADGGQRICVTLYPSA